MTTKLKLYNEALRLCGEGPLSALTDTVEARYLLDSVWDNGGVEACLEEGEWKFAARTISMDYDTTVTSQFGFTRAFPKPSDWIGTIGISADEYMNTPLNHYVDENGYWWCDEDLLYIKYISNGTAYGNDLSLWPSSFADYVAAHFARKIIYKFTSDKDRIEQALRDEKNARLIAKNKDAKSGPTKFPPEGAWTSSRRQGSSERSRGNKNSLIG